MAAYVSNRLLMDRYLRGKDILCKLPDHRTDEELNFLRKWLPENIQLFQNIDSGDLRMILERVMLETYFPNEVIYEQEATVTNFYVILRGSLSLLVDANNKGLQTTSNTLNTSVLSSKETRRVSKHLPTQKVNPKNTSIPNRHMYGREVSRLFSGDHFGEEALLQREDRALHTAQTNDMVELLVIDADIFAQCLHPYFEEIVLKRAEFLAGLEWFRNWSPHLLRQLTFMLRERHYQFEECLYRQGMSVPGIWFIRSGSVRISTQHDSQTPKELLDKIEPPIDYLPEILAEDLPEQTTSKSSIFSNTSQRSSIIEASAVFLNKPSSQTSLQKEVSSPTKKKSTARKGRAMMGYVIHRPNPKTNVDLCILGPGDILCDNEAVCRLRKHLFNAVCESNVVVYELNRFYFELMFENQVPRVLHQMSCRAQQRVESWEESVIHQMSHRIQHQVGGWGEKHFEIRFFVPLMTVLKQTADKLETEGAHKIGRKKALYNPEMLAWTAIKGLGKTPKEASVTKEVHVVIRIQSAESCSSQLAKCPPTPIPVSPFEPRVPDFEMMSSMMRFTDPRFNALRQRNEKTIFDSPLPARGSSGHVLTSDIVIGQDSIPVPAPYPARKSASLPILKKEVSVENEAPVEDKPEPKIDKAKLKEDEFAKRFPTANDPDTLASIKLGLKFGKTSALTSCGCTSMQDAKERLKQTRSQSKQSGAKSAEKGLAIPILTTPTLRSISLDRHMRSARQSIAADRKDEETDTTSKTETRVSFSMDHELTDIPKEYSRLCGKGEWHSQRGAGGCAVCRQHYRDMCSNTCTMPFMKTMMKVIENRTSSLLTKYRLSLAVNSTMAQRKYCNTVPHKSGSGHTHTSPQHCPLRPLLGCGSGTKRLTKEAAAHQIISGTTVGVSRVVHPRHHYHHHHQAVKKKRLAMTKNQWLPLKLETKSK